MFKDMIIGPRGDELVLGGDEKPANKELRMTINE